MDCFIAFILGLGVTAVSCLGIVLEMRAKSLRLQSENERLTKENADLCQRNLLLCDSLIQAHEEIAKWERIPGVVERIVLSKWN
jgi:hypothetical protein